MRKIVFVGLLLLTIVVSVQAVDGEYHLRVPSATEYIERVTEIAQQQDPQNEWPTRNLYSGLTDAVFRRFPDLDQVDYQQILAAYDAMGIGRDGYFWRRGQWVEAIFAAWLRQTQPDFSSSNELTFEDFRIGILPYDFDADGQDEYVLDIIKGEPTDRYDCRYQAEYVNYLAVQLTNTGYQLIKTPLYWNGYGTDAVSNFGEGGQVEYNFEDINADGLPEWLVLIGGETFGGPGMGYENTGRLYILGWRDGRLIDLAMLGDGRRYPYSVTAYGEDSFGCDNAVPRDVTWEFSNIDDDGAQEILQHQLYQDNWQCIVRTTKVIDWDATQERYVQIDERRDFPEDSQNCARRQAEEAMWDGNYEEALEHYERALVLSPYIDPDENNLEVDEYYREQARNRRITYDQYHLARMALAYQLTGQPEKARAILESLREQEFSYEPVQYFVQALIAAPDTPFGACLAAYTTFAQHFRSSSHITYFLGVTRERDYDTYVDYSPARVGCDALPMLETELQTRTFAADRLPEEHLNNLGMDVRKAIQADLNGDGQDEWLVWPESPMNPFFFVVDETGDYAVSTPAVDPFDHADDIRLWRLPDDVGTAIAYLTSPYANYFQEPWDCAYDPICGMGGGGYTCLPNGERILTLWRMDGLTLTQNGFNVCGIDFATLFPDGEGSTVIDGGEIIPDEGVSYASYDLLRYEWDSSSRNFVKFTTGVEPTPFPTPIPTPEPKYRYVDEALAAGDYPAALTMLDEAAARNRDYYRENPDALYAYQYQRAFILEALNRLDEALTEYIAIYEAAPDSAWGMLAGLHFESSE
jgi:tetratricopeptide (TPR) repeat protein